MTIRALGIRWLAVAALGAATANVLSGQAAARIAGVVHDASGRPLAGARVRLLRPMGAGDEVESDSLGRFTFADAPMPGGLLVARRVGFAPDSVPVLPVGAGTCSWSSAG